VTLTFARSSQNGCSILEYIYPSRLSGPRLTRRQLCSRPSHFPTASDRLRIQSFDWGKFRTLSGAMVPAQLPVVFVCHKLRPVKLAGGPKSLLA
jgi:hypothetical protein